MSAPAEANKSPPPESPTTVRPFEMDDDDVQDTAGLGEDAPAPHAPHAPPQTTTNPTGADGQAPAAATVAERAPPQPPRPMTEQEKNELILKEAFPTVEVPVVKAVLSASRGNIEAAFHALLEMTDPGATSSEPQQEAAPPPPPPQPPRPSDNARAQLESDERYARQLAQHYENVSAYEARTSSRPQGGRAHPGAGAGFGPGPGAAARQAPRGNAPGSEREYSFMDDDLPLIRENLRKGFVETQSKVGGWIANIKKKLDETFDDFDDDEHPQAGQGRGRGQGQGQGPSGAAPMRRQPAMATRPSGDYERYDADAEHLGDDFAGIKLATDSTVPQNRQAGVQSGEEDIYTSSPLLPPSKNTPPAEKPTAKASKWQPLSSVDPSPMAENDPFSLGDSDDDKDVGKGSDNKPAAAAGTKDGKDDDTERLKQAAAEAMADSLVDAKSGEEAAGKND